MPGIFAQTIVFAAATTAIGMSDDINKGIIDRFRSLPMARSAVLTGRTIVGRRLQRRHPRRADGHAASRSAGRSTTGSSRSSPASRCCCCSPSRCPGSAIWLGLSVPTVEVAQQVSFTVIFPITFISSVFVPIAEHADLAPAVRRVEPDQHADARPATLWGNPETNPPTDSLASTDPILVTLIWVVVILAVFAPLGVRRYRSMSR